jgi:PIN domain nuclease of toxin-antitoxin system
MVLLDTCAAIWLFEQAPLSQVSLAAVRSAAISTGVFVSPVSAWEVGLLATGRRRAVFEPSAQAWFDDLLALPGVRLIPLTHRAAIAASSLPGHFHRDPADRLLVATAREFRVPLVTRDRRILDYAGQGHVDAIPC